MDRSIKIAVCLALLASFPLALWSTLLSSRIGHPFRTYLLLFPDTLAGSPALRTTCVVLTILAVGYGTFIVVRAFYRGANTRGHLVITCVIWVLGTFALHCWVLYGLVGGMPCWPAAKRDSEEMTMALNSGLTGYAGSGEDRARARAAMQMQMPRAGLTVPPIEQKLALALRFEESQQVYWKSIATAADNAERRTARHAWVSWTVIAFTPVVVVVLASRQRVRKGRD